MSARSVDLLDEEAEAAKELFLLTAKPQMFCLNTDEAGMSKSGTIIAEFVERLRVKKIEIQVSDCVAICAKLEEELASFDDCTSDQLLL